MDFGDVEAAGVDGVVVDFAEFAAGFVDDWFAFEAEVIVEDFLEADEVIGWHDVVGAVDDHAEAAEFSDVADVEDGWVEVDGGAFAVEGDDVEFAGVDDWVGAFAYLGSGL